jgi:hypothetical protein
MSATVQSAVVQIAFTVDEELVPARPELLRMLDLLDMDELARAFDTPDAETARAGLRRGATIYDRLITDAADELRTHCHVEGTSLLVCTASEAFLSAVQTDGFDEDALDRDVAASWIGDLGVFLVLLEQVPALGAPAGLVCLGMPSLDTIVAYASTESLAGAAYSASPV